MTALIIVACKSDGQKRVEAERNCPDYVDPNKHQVGDEYPCETPCSLGSAPTCFRLGEAWYKDAERPMFFVRGMEEMRARTFQTARERYEMGCRALQKGTTPGACPELAAFEKKMVDYWPAFAKPKAR